MPTPTYLLLGALAVLLLGAAIVALQLNSALHQIIAKNPDAAKRPPARETFGDGHGAPLEIAVLGDSLGTGTGADSPAGTPAALLATGLAERLGRPVHVTTVARFGTGARNLRRQLREVYRTGAPRCVLVVTGANDAAFPARLHASAVELGRTVRILRADGARVVACTCPDLGAVPGIPRPARWYMQALGRILARLQHRQILANGGRAVLVHRDVSPAFSADRSLLSADQWHPNSRGYALSTAPVIEAFAELLAEPDGALALPTVRFDAA